MAFDPGLTQGDILSNRDLSEVFQCGNMGGMRRSHATGTLVIVSDHTKGLYADKWFGDELHYTGMGSTGEMSKTYAQNYTLLHSATNGVPVFLFEVYQSGKYIYQGEVYLSGEPYQETQPDKNRHLRKVWMFPVKLKEGIPIRVDENLVEKVHQRQLKEARKLSKDKIKDLAEGKSGKLPAKRNSTSSSYERDPIVILYALERADGSCQLCEFPAPFNRKDGTPFLEVHHVEYLANGGTDTIDNVVALCPNCHRKMHALEDSSDFAKLKQVAQERL